jgi:non-ribosomal peptide synthase protein (TIGR01720 family)
MIIESIEHRIKALSPKARKLLLVRLKEVIDLKTAETSHNGRKRILAYVQGNKSFSVDRLKEDLQKKLPDYMIPSKIIPVSSIPLLPNGKIDRKQLATMAVEEKKSFPIQIERVSDDGLSKIEQQLVIIWEETLGFSPIRKNDNFFEIGGDSILSIQIIAKARKAKIILQANSVFEHQTITELALFAKETLQNDISVEEKLLKIWEETLGFSPIQRDDNFFEIGGDSILSIQIIAKARKEGLILKANDLFENQTVGELSLFVKAETEEKGSGILQGLVPLSPIQHWFFNNHKNAPQYWNQGVRIDNLPSLTESQLAEICVHLITQHDTLRSRFTQKENEWVQEISTPDQICALKYIDLSKIETEKHEDKVLEQTQLIQDQFILAKGSLFKCIYFSTVATSNDFCILIGHHLLVDIVSWQIIIDDFKTALNEVHAGEAISRDTKTSSFKDWTEYIKSYAENVTAEELLFWQSQITPVPVLPYDKESHTIVLEKDLARVDFSFDTAITKVLVEANQALNTKTGELLISAFLETIGIWSGHKDITIGFERHGRETNGSQLDVSKTVGWFTSYFPLQFEFQPNNSIDTQIIAVKEKIRSIPNGGIGYGGLRYIKNTFGDIASPEIVFNFLGNQISSQSNNANKLTWLHKKLRDPRSERHYKLEVNLGIIDDVLKGSFSFGKNVHNAETINKLMSDFKNRIQAICEYCNQSEKGRYTPSDFSEVEISQDDLDNLLDSLR